MREIRNAFSLRDFVKTSGDRLAERRRRVSGAFEGIGRNFAEHGLEFGEHLLDWIEIRAVCRKVHKYGTAALNGFAHPLDLVNGYVVHEHDVTSPQYRSENLFDIGPKCLAVHRAFEYKRRSHSVVAKRGDKRGCLPIAMQYLLNQALAAWSAAIDPGDAGHDAGFIDEYELFWVQPRLPPSQGAALGRDVWAILLGGV